MKIYDISQPLFGCEVYPGDKAPTKSLDKSIAKGDKYNLTNYLACAHNGTHIDAPFHFIDDGDTVDKIPLEKTVGECYVTFQEQDITAKVAESILVKARAVGAGKRILIKGKGVVTEEGARVFSKAGIYLIGVEAQSVGNVTAPMAVHKILLKEKIVLLEGLNLSAINEGEYFLSAPPINLNGADGAPTRAILIER